MAEKKQERTMLDNLIESVDVLDKKVPQLIDELKRTAVDDENYSKVLANLEKSIALCINYRGTANRAIAEIAAQKQKQENTKDTEKGE